MQYWIDRQALAAFVARQVDLVEAGSVPELLAQVVELRLRHESASREEVGVITQLVGALAEGGLRWRDGEGQEHPLGVGDILVIAPYNAQVSDLHQRLPAEMRVGTVDKFQGQQAPVVIYSLATSTAQDAPRGMDFLYDPNRFNVATSRAKCACIVVGSPRLFEPD